MKWRKTKAFASVVTDIDVSLYCTCGRKEHIYLQDGDIKKCPNCGKEYYVYSAIYIKEKIRDEDNSNMQDI